MARLTRRKEMSFLRVSTEKGVRARTAVTGVLGLASGFVAGIALALGCAVAASGADASFRRGPRQP